MSKYSSTNERFKNVCSIHQAKDCKIKNKNKYKYLDTNYENCSMKKNICKFL